MAATVARPGGPDSLSAPPLIIFAAVPCSQLASRGATFLTYDYLVLLPARSRILSRAAILLAVLLYPAFLPGR